jgi:hypothetical protein
MKQCYWTDLLNTLTEEDNNMIGLWRKVMVLDAIYRVSRARYSVNPVMLVCSWRKLLPDLEKDDMQGFLNK